MHGHNIYGAITHIDPRIGLAAFSIILAVFMLFHPVSTEQTGHDMAASVNGSVENLSFGVSVDGDSIDFGSLPDRAVTVNKDITVQNVEEYPATLHFHVDGNISVYTTLSNDSVDLAPGEQESITVTLETTDMIDEGEYSGHLTVFTRRPLYQFFLDRL